MAANPTLGTPPANLPSLVPAGPHAGNPPLPLKKLVALVGSHEKCHLRLMSSTVSKHHALIITTSVGVYIRDLASRTKVVVNGETVREGWLQENDQVRIGKFLFTFNTPVSRPQMPTPAPQATLIVGGKSADRPIQGMVVLIGRQAGCDVKLRDDGVSSRHAVIFEAAGKRYIRDLNSRTGTYVNGNKIHLEEIKFGDEIRIGEEKLSLKSTTAVEAELMPEPSPVQTDESLPLEPLTVELESPSPAEPRRVAAQPQPVEEEEAALPPEPQPLPVEASTESPTALEPIALAPPDEPIALAAEPPAPAAPVESAPPVPAKPQISVMPRIELIPMHPQTGAVIQLRSPIPAAPPKAPPPPAAPVKPPAAPVESAAPPSAPRPQPHPAVAAPVAVTPPTPAPAPTAPIKAAAPPPAAPVVVSSPSIAAPPPRPIQAPVAPPFAPLPQTAVAMDRPAAAPPAPVQPPRPAPPQTTAIQLHADRPAPSIPPASAPPQQAAGEPRSWTSRANVKRTPPSAAELVAQPEPQPPTRKADVPKPSHAGTVSPAPAQSATVDLSAQMQGERAATIDEESAQQASEPPLIASELNLRTDRGRDSSDDLLFVEEDFAQALPMPPDLVGEEADEPESRPTPIVGLQVRPEDFADAPPPAPVRPPMVHASPPPRVIASPPPPPAPLRPSVVYASPAPVSASPPPVVASAPPPPVSVSPPPTPTPVRLPPVVASAPPAPPVSVSPPPAPAQEIRPLEAPAPRESIPGLRIGPEDFADVVRPVLRRDYAGPLHAAVQKSLPEGFVDLREPPVRPAPLFPPPPLEETSEVLDLNQAEPVLDLDLDLLPLSIETPSVPNDLEMEDSTFTSLMENFSGETIGVPLEQPTPARPQSTAYSEPFEHIATANDASMVAANEPAEPEPLHETFEPQMHAPPPPHIATIDSATVSLPEEPSQTIEPMDEPSALPLVEGEIEEPRLTPVAPPTLAATITSPHPPTIDLDDEPDVAEPHESHIAPVEQAHTELPPAQIETPPLESPIEDTHSIGSAPLSDFEPEAEDAEPQGRYAHIVDEALPQPIAAQTADTQVPAEQPAPEAGQLLPEESPQEMMATVDASAVAPQIEPDLAEFDQSESAPTEAPADSSAPPAPKADSPFATTGEESAFPTFTANLDHFLGGMPMKLPDLPKPPASARRLEVSFGDRPPPSERQPEPPPPALDAGPAMIQTPPPPKAVTARATPSKPAPFATGYNISADQAAAPAESTTSGPATDKGSMEKLTSIFEGLAMSPIHEKDVFSDMEATALNDAAFGGARLSRSDDYVLPETPEHASRLSSGDIQDFAEDEFWERTDEQEGVPPMGVPQPQDFQKEQAAPASADEMAPVEVPVQGPIEPIEPPIGLPMVASGASVAGTIPPANFSRDLPRPAAPSSHGVPPVPRPRPRRRRLIPFLMLAMLLSMGAAYAAIWYLVPPRSHVYGSMTFLNYDWVAGTAEGVHFEATQRQLLAADDTRKHALQLLQQHDPQMSGGFLQIPDLYGRVLRGIGVSSARENGQPQTQIKLSYDGADENGDRVRMGALLAAMIDANASTLDSGRRMHEDADRARHAVEETAAQLEQTKSQIAGLQRTVEEAPSAEKLAEMGQKQSQLEQARFVAEDAVDTDRANLSRLRSAAMTADQAPGGSGNGTLSPSADPQLQQMGKQLVELNAKLEASKRSETSGVSQARGQLEDAVKQFNDELTTAGGVLDNSSVLKQFVDSAKNSQNKAHELITMLVVDGEDLEKQLEDTRREVEDLIQSRQQEVWSADPKLLDLTAKRDSAQHRFNANVGEGINDPVILDPLQKEIESLGAAIKARQAELGVDPSEVKLANGLARVIDSLRNRLQKEKQQIDDVLDPLEKQLKDMDPTVAALPDAQRALAQQIRQRLATLNDARRNYAQAVGEGAAAPSAVETDLQKQIDDLKTRYDERQANLAEQVQKTVGDDRARELANAQARLDADKKALDQAKNAYDAARVEFDDQTARQRDAQAAATSIQLAKDQQGQQTRALAAAQHDLQQKQAEADLSFDIKPFSDSDVTSMATDPRRDYVTYAIVGLAVIFAFLVLAASQPSGGEAPAPAEPKPAGEPRHDDDADLATA